MQHLARSLALIATAALAVPAVGHAVDDGDIYPGDPDARTTIIAADGTVSDGAASPSSRAFVETLVGQKARGGVLRLDTSGYRLPTVIRTGYTAPTTKLAPLQGRDKASRKLVAVRWTTDADGTRVQERGMAVEIATGKLRRVTIDDAKRFSADPESGKPGLYYHYLAESRITAGSTTD